MAVAMRISNDSDEEIHVYEENEDHDDSNGRHSSHHRNKHFYQHIDNGHHARGDGINDTTLLCGRPAASDKMQFLGERILFIWEARTSPFMGW